MPGCRRCSGDLRQVKVGVSDAAELAGEDGSTADSHLEVDAAAAALAAVGATGRSTDGGTAPGALALISGTVNISRQPHHRRDHQQP